MDKQIEQFILDILADHNILTLATVRDDGYPQATTVTYVNDGLEIYFLTGPECQKVGNIQRCNKVSLTIDREYEDWHQIKGLSMGGIAEILSDPDEITKAITCLETKFPQIHEWGTAEDISKAAAFVKITPQVISVLNYEKEFGHTELVAVET
ncbi:MAG: pyridoxamine 5'-phosphate oxidase family protein [Leptolyngbyaceae cyanobacterium MO_188.B28]|nr:pyridoxamine 5'-phosphate oxidase family protein [Leptolyngbyaceae cyanobacterium MO_188.B28]